MPIIEENWSIIENDSPNVTWARGNKLIYTKKPFHLYKEIRYLDENRVVEIDAVHYQQSDSASYRLLITSLFEDHVDVKTKEYKLITYYPGKFPPSKTKILTGYAGDSILKHLAEDSVMMDPNNNALGSHGLAAKAKDESKTKVNNKVKSTRVEKGKKKKVAHSTIDEATFNDVLNQINQFLNKK